MPPRRDDNYLSKYYNSEFGRGRFDVTAWIKLVAILFGAWVFFSIAIRVAAIILLDINNSEISTAVVSFLAAICVFAWLCKR